MIERPRVYTSILQDHFQQHRQMAWISGPRQVGKTTTCREIGKFYLNWDNLDDRRLLLQGPKKLAEYLELHRLRVHAPIIVLDELHKHAKWKTLLKGFYDTYREQSRVIVTGSSRLDIFRRGGDSLMGRYFLYRMHPLSVGECLRVKLPTVEISPPLEISQAKWDALWEHGGFPEPFLKHDSRFTRRWRSLRMDLLTREDLREAVYIQDIGVMETLVHLLAEYSAQQIIYSNLAQEISVSVDTLKRWLDLLTRFHYGFLIRPWFKNVTKSLRKEPKWFLRDWSGIEDEGKRAETMVACHLLKAVEGWTDLGIGNFELRYLRDKQKREVDFLVVRNRKPWFLVEVKTNGKNLNPSLIHFQNQTKADHAFQVIINLPFEKADCFQAHKPIIVPAKTFLSQLL